VEGALINGLAGGMYGSDQRVTSIEEAAHGLLKKYREKNSTKG
jgi:hypothetical protein